MTDKDARTGASTACLQEVLDSATNAGVKGQSQFSTPLSLATVAGELLPELRLCICDLSGGRGQFIAGAQNCTTKHGLVVEIQPMRSIDVDRPEHNPMHWHRITGDITTVYPVLKKAGFQCDIFTLNPPFDMHWHRDKLELLASSDVGSVARAYHASDGRMGKDQIDSTVASMMLALDLMTDRGEGVMIANNSTLDRLLFRPDAPYRTLAQHVWTHVVIDGNPMTEDSGHEYGPEFRTGIIYFAASHSGPRKTYSFASVEQFRNFIPRDRASLRLGIRSGTQLTYLGLCRDSSKEFDAVKEEIAQLRKGEARSDYNIWLDKDGVTIRTYLSNYDNITLLRRKEMAQVMALHRLNGQEPMQLVMQAASRRALQQAVCGTLWRVDPRLPELVKQAIAEYNGVRAPLYPLPPTQRLGYLDEEKFITCTKSLDDVFTEGKTYDVESMTVSVERQTTKPNHSGGHDQILLNGQELMLMIRDNGGQLRSFIDGRHMCDGVVVTHKDSNNVMAADYDLRVLLDHFDIPDVPDVSVTQEETFESNRLLLKKVNDFVNERIDPGFKFKRFQVEDYARAACHDGLVLAHDTGLGKSLASIAYPLLKAGVDWTTSRRLGGLYPLRPVLLVAPENLHAQLRQEWKRRFGIEVTHLDSQDTYISLRKKGPLNGWYVTSYTQLGLNKIKEMPDPDECPNDAMAIAELMHFYRVTVDDCAAYEPKDGDGPATLFEKAIALCRELYVRYSEGVGEWHNGIKCVFSPSLADLCGHEFAAVVIDEGTRIKGEATIIGRAVRQLNPQFRMVLTATPVKNRLRDIFWLLHWAAGGRDEAHARFPYPNDPEADDQFAAEFNVCERNLTKEAEKKKGAPPATRRRDDGKKKRTRGKPGVEVCNIHRLWKLIAPLVLRRRKADIGEDIVQRKKHVIRVPMGTKQHEVYRYHLLGEYLDKNGNPAIAAQLQILRSCSSAPASPLLHRLPDACESGGEVWRSDNDYIPKLAAALRVIEERMRAGEQSVVFSALNEPLDTLSRRLTEAGVPHDVLDGRKSGAWRGKMSQEFQRGLPKAKPVLLGGMRAMAEGNNWPKANNVIVFTYDWAWDLYAQCIDRCYRLNSEKDVNIWPIVCSGTIDSKIESMTEEKGDAAELVIDGQLLGEDSQEVDLMELMKIARREFRNAETYPEAKLELEWPELREKLADAWHVCQGVYQPKPKQQPAVTLPPPQLLLLNLAGLVRARA